jgi:hypothetical protein
MALFKLGRQVYLSGDSVAPVGSVLSGELALQKNFP